MAVTVVRALWLTLACQMLPRAVESAVSSTERAALMDLYTSTNGADWLERGGWGSAADPCTWHGLGCIGGNLTSVDLSVNRLAGTIPPSIEQLRGLITLTMHSNPLLSGAIPASIGNLIMLESLDLCFCQIGDTLPAELGNLASLQHLKLIGNEVKGAMPDSLSNLKNLKYLWLSSNRRHSAK